MEIKEDRVIIIGPQLPITADKREIKDFPQTQPSMLMYYVYILKNKRTNRPYIGYTEDLERRLAGHKKNDDDMEIVLL